MLQDWFRDHSIARTSLPVPCYDLTARRVRCRDAVVVRVLVTYNQWSGSIPFLLSRGNSESVALADRDTDSGSSGNKQSVQVSSSVVPRCFGSLGWSPVVALSRKLSAAHKRGSNRACPVCIRVCRALGCFVSKNRKRSGEVSFVAFVVGDAELAGCVVELFQVACSTGDRG